MRKIRESRFLRPFAGLVATLCLTVWYATPTWAALQKPIRPRGCETQTPDEQLRREIAEKGQAAKQQPDVRELSEAEMAKLRGRGQYRNRNFSGVLPWQRSFHDVNLCNGNLFKSFTDIQVSPARGAGLAFQRTYNSNDDRVGPFGIGWTHAYDIRVEEAPNNQVARTDFFGGKHYYQRDADGLYSPPPYMFDELSSEYDNFLANGPAEVLSDEQRGKDGAVKHFISGGTDPDGTPSGERVCDYIEDRHGNRTNLTYGLTINLPGGGTKHLLTQVTDPSGRSLQMTWQNLGTQAAPAWRIVQVQGPFDQNGSPVYTVTYEYNAEFNLWKVHQDPAGLNRVTTYGYTTVAGESGLLASISDPLGHTVSYEYSLTAPNYTASPTGTLWVTKITEPGSGGSIYWQLRLYAGYGGNHAFSAGFDGPLPTFYMMVSVDVDPYLRAYITHNSDHGIYYAVYTSEYDSSNNVVRSETRPEFPWGGRDQILVSTYTPHGDVWTQTNEGFGETVTYSYYDATKYFQQASVTDAKGNTTWFDYYDSNDPNPGNRGQVKWVRDARYNVTGQQFEYTYNQYGQKLTETNLNDVVTQYTYGDQWGNLTQVVQDPGAGHLNRTTTQSYDVAGRVVQNTDPKGQTSSFTYNGVGQPLSASLPGEAIAYTYGANGRTETVTDGRGTTTLTYEPGNDFVSSVADPVTGTTSYTYLRSGQRATMTLPGGGTWTYTYRAGSSGDSTDPWVFWLLPKDDPSSQTPILEKITDDQGREVLYHYDQTGVLDRVRFNQTSSSYTETSYTYDSQPYGSITVGHGRLSRIQHVQYTLGQNSQWQARVLVQNDYTSDDNGNRLTNTISDQNGPVRTETYGYDALSRLTSVNYGDGDTQSYTFDPMGNRLTKVHNGVTESYSYNNANMLLSRAGQAYTNDLNGNTLTGGGRTNTWDGQNRIVSSTYNGTTSTFTYGADGLRRRMVTGNNTTDYVLDGDNVVRTLLNGAVDRTYLHGPRGPEYERVGNNAPTWYLYDGLGSVLGTVDAAGNLVSTRKYDVYGAVRGSTGPSGTRHKFVGNLGHPSDDETGLIYMRARYYDPVTGRFASEDPERDGVNWFIYARNNPVVLVDQSGGTAGLFNATIGNLLVIIGMLLLKNIASQLNRAAIAKNVLEKIATLPFENDSDVKGLISFGRESIENILTLAGGSSIGGLGTLATRFAGYQLLIIGQMYLTEADFEAPGSHDWWGWEAVGSHWFP